MTDLPVLIPKGMPKLGPQGNQAPQQIRANVQTNTAARSHNVFRPDIFRVSEGYLN